MILGSFDGILPGHIIHDAGGRVEPERTVKYKIEVWILRLGQLDLFSCEMVSCYERDARSITALGKERAADLVLYVLKRCFHLVHHTIMEFAFMIARISAFSTGVGIKFKISKMLLLPYCIFRKNGIL